MDDGNEQSLYYGDRFTKETVDDRSEYYQLPFNHRADIVAHATEWVQDTVIYNIFPDSFATGHRFISGMETEKDYGQEKVHGKLGGTIKGITENIDYLRSLVSMPFISIRSLQQGNIINMIWWITGHIDPCFGTEEEFGKLVQHCHEKGIRVIIDGVFNHCGWHFTAFRGCGGEKAKHPTIKGLVLPDWNIPVVRPRRVRRPIPGYECFGYGADDAKA